MTADDNWRTENVFVNADPNVHRTRHDWEGSTGLYHTIVRAVSAVTGVKQMELQPLFDIVDPEALERLLTSHDDPREGAAVMFDYGGCDLTVHSSGEIVIRYDDEQEPRHGDCREF